MGLHKFNVNKAINKLHIRNNKNKYVKNGLVILCVIVFVFTIIYFSYSKYSVTNKYNVMQTTVGNFASEKTLVNYLTSIQSSNSDSLTYDGTSDNNLRYYGKNPNNYIRYNGEIWRIIGVMNNVKTSDNKNESLVKIIRNDSIGNYSWDSSASSINSGYGVNEWSQADVMALLNNGAYWNKSAGNCYNGLNNSTTSCDFTSNGLKSDSKNLIQNVIWNTGTNSNTITRLSNIPSMYGYERSNINGKSSCNSGTSTGASFCNDSVGRTTTWTGNVGLIYPSDMGYATGGGSNNTRNICLSNYFNNWNNYTDCYSNDWLYNSVATWMLTPSAESDYSNAAFAILNNGRIYGGNNAIDANSIYPALYLKSSVIYSSGTGTLADPYDIYDSEYDFDYTGGEQTFTAPKDGYYKLETWGAQGGTANTSYPSTGGYGGYSTGVVSLAKTNNLYINVGGSGSPNNNSNTAGAIGGYNGGGNSGYVNTSIYGEIWSASGGGATHIAKASGLLKSLNNNINSILLVAGGGGGGFFHNNLSVHAWGEGGSGGGYIGGTGKTYGSGYTVGTGGTQTASGTGFTKVLPYIGGFGTGGYGVMANGGCTETTSGCSDGGGGGLYGGGPTVYAGAGGGSGYIGNTLLVSLTSLTKHMTCYNCSASTDASTKTTTTTNTSSTATSEYAKLGNGYVKITYLGSTLS